MLYSIILLFVMAMIGFGAYIYKSFQKDKMMDGTNKLYQEQNNGNNRFQNSQSTDFENQFKTDIIQNSNMGNNQIFNNGIDDNKNQPIMMNTKNESYGINQQPINLNNNQQYRINNNSENNFNQQNLTSQNIANNFNQQNPTNQNVAFVNNQNNSNNNQGFTNQQNLNLNQIDKNEVDEIETGRKKARNTQIITWGIVAVIIIIVIIIYFSILQSAMRGDASAVGKAESFKNIVPFALFIVFAIAIIITGKKKSKYTNTYKTEVIGKMIKSINPNLTYQPEVYGTMVSSINQVYQQAKFDNCAFNRFYADDYLEGFLSQNVYIKMSDLDVEYETGSTDNSGSSRTIVFQGLFAMTNCNIDIGTNIKIKRHEIRVFDSKDRFKLDDEVFEKHFDVYTQDGVKTMQILTPDIMEQLVNFVDVSGIKFEVVFDGNKILFRFFTGKMFEPSVFKDSMDPQILEFYSNILKFTLDVTNKINKILTQGNIV